MVLNESTKGNWMENKKIKKNGLLYKTLILWFIILILASFAASLQTKYDIVGIQVAPEVLREGEPVVVTFFINNPSEKAAGTDYTLYANGNVLMSGRTELSPRTGKQFQYVYSLSLIHISEPTRLGMISYAVFCLKKKKRNNPEHT